MLTGVNIDATVALARELRTPVIASGGLTDLDDVKALCEVEPEGIMGAITGRAVYQGTLDFKQAQELADELGEDGNGKAGKALTRGVRSVPSATIPASAAPMALAKRIIPCLDVTAGRVVKGVNFVGLRDAGDPVEIARRYDEQGADELTFLDITASSDERDSIVHVVEAVAAQVFIPLTVGGGVRSAEDVRRLLNAGADKVAINTAAVQDPAARRRRGGHASARSASSSRSTRSASRSRAGRCSPTAGASRPGSTRSTGRAGCKRAGAGEILLTSMDRDGTRAGFDLELTRAFSDAVDVPVIASGGVGNLEHLADGVLEGHADAVLAASIFHYGEYTVRQAKEAHGGARHRGQAVSHETVKHGGSTR